MWYVHSKRKLSEKAPLSFPGKNLLLVLNNSRGAVAPASRTSVSALNARKGEKVWFLRVGNIFNGKLITGFSIPLFFSSALHSDPCLSPKSWQEWSRTPKSTRKRQQQIVFYYKMCASKAGQGSRCMFIFSEDQHTKTL